MRLSRRGPGWVVGLVLSLLALLLPTGVAAQTDGAAGACHDRDDAAYATHDCKVDRLGERSFVVVAVIDTGINPYHVDFRLPADDDLVGVHPSEFIDGFPAQTPAVDLTLDTATYQDAYDRDVHTWRGLERDTLYTLPGTKVIGGWSSSMDPIRGGPVIDDGPFGAGHGTATASVAAGLVHGVTPDVDVLIVAVQGLHAHAVAWATSQPWIDVVTNSWGYQFNANSPTTGEHHHSRDFTDRGGIFAVAAGNGFLSNGAPCGPTLTSLSTMTGPPWNVVVGAVSPHNDQPHCWHSIPPDVSSYGSDWPAAAHRSLDGSIAFGGTSNATPIVAGVMASLVLEARRAVGDTGTGPRDGELVVAAQGAALPQAGPLADGRLDARTVTDIVFKTATVTPFDPGAATVDTVPNTPAYFVYAGYGLVNDDTRGDALEVVFGRAPLPDRSDVDTWMVARNTVQAAVWDTLP